MNTVSVTGSLSRNAGGLFESVRRLHQSLAKIPGVNVAVLGLRDEFTDADLPFWQPVPTQAFSVLGPKRFGFAPRLNKALFKMDCDIIHTHGVWMYFSIAVTKLYRRRKVPYLISAHGMLDPWAIKNSPWKKRLAHAGYEGVHLRNAACLRALCEAEAQAFRKCGLKTPVCIIPNGIDLPRLSGNQLSALGGPLQPLKASGRKILLYLGRIHPKKGLANLVRAWAAVQNSQKSILNSRRGEWLLAIAGWDEGGHRNELKQLAMELGISFADVSRNAGRQGEAGLSNQKSGGRSVQSSISLPASSEPPSLFFLGPQFNEAKMSCYYQCDAFVLPSFSEGFPMVVLEAWAYGKPVLMTPECNLPEGFESNAAIRITTGVENIAHGLRQLFDMSAANCQTVGERGKKLVIEEYSWSRISAKMKGVYDWVLGGGAKPESVSLDQGS